MNLIVFPAFNSIVAKKIFAMKWHSVLFLLPKVIKVMKADSIEKLWLSILIHTSFLLDRHYLLIS